jgi:uncharacterized protein YndB with AHSA1/START domain
MSCDMRLYRLVDAQPEVAFDTFVDPEAQHQLYAEEPDWIVESECDLRIGGHWTISFGPPETGRWREANVFKEIIRPRRLCYCSTMTRPDGSSVDTEIDVTFEIEGDKTRVTVVQRGFPTDELRDSFTDGWASALDELGRVAHAKAIGHARTTSESRHSER